MGKFTFSFILFLLSSTPPQSFLLAKHLLAELEDDTVTNKATDPLPEKDNEGIEETAAMESGLPVGKGSDYRQSVAGYSQWLTMAHSMRVGNRLFLPGWKNA